ASDFLVCPGNHDICWANQAARYEPSALVTVASETAQANYIEFVKNALGFELAPGVLDIGRHLLLANGVALDIIALNSSQLEQQDFAGYGFVSGKQLNRAIEEMGWQAAAKGARYRMLVLHHHVVPVLSVETIDRLDARYSVTLDAGELLYRALELEVDLVAHGHMHKPFGAIYGRFDTRSGHVADTRRVAIQAAGSAGVDADHLPNGVGRNSYLIYEFHPEHVRVRRRATSPNADRFDDDGEHLLHRGEAGLQ
ncbi:MAG: metallophosphoesterase family protein, partial [Solirubrobacteraceae bacterium]